MLFKLLILSISQLTFAFTLFNGVACYNVEEIQVFVSTASCNNTGFSQAQLKEYVQSAVEQHWNRVSTSRVKFVMAGDSATSTAALASASAAATAAAPNTVLLGCNSNAVPFPNGTTTLGLGSISCSGGTCRGGVILNDTGNAATGIDTLSESQILALIAHELGHTVGIGHSTQDSALMTPQINDIQEWLTQDDIDAITYICPNDSELGGLIGGCATIKDIDSTDSNGTPLAMIFLASIFLILTRQLKISYSI